MAGTSTALTKFYVGTTRTPSTTATEFALDTYKEIKGLIEVAEIGGSIERGTTDRIDTGLREVYKAVKDLGEPEFLVHVYRGGSWTGGNVCRLCRERCLQLQDRL